MGHHCVGLILHSLEYIAYGFCGRKSNPDGDGGEDGTHDLVGAREDGARGADAEEEDVGGGGVGAEEEGEGRVGEVGEADGCDFGGSSSLLKREFPENLLITCWLAGEGC